MGTFISSHCLNSVIKINRGKKMSEDEDRGVLVCCDCGGSPSSEPMEDVGCNIWSALCAVCRDWADFKYEKDMEEEND